MTTKEHAVENITEAIRHAKWEDFANSTGVKKDLESQTEKFKQTFEAFNKISKQVDQNLPDGALFIAHLGHTNPSSCGGRNIPADFDMADVSTAMKRSWNISRYTSISKGGKMFKTIRIPKWLCSPLKRTIEMHPILLLTPIANYLWHNWYSVKPPAGAIRIFLTCVKQAINVPVNKTFSSENVGKALSMIQERFPDFAAGYMSYRESRKDYEKKLQSLKNARREEAAAMEIKLDALSANPANIVAVFSEILHDSGTIAKDLINANAPKLVTLMNDVRLRDAGSSTISWPNKTLKVTVDPAPSRKNVLKEIESFTPERIRKETLEGDSVYPILRLALREGVLTLPRKRHIIDAYNALKRDAVLRDKMINSIGEIVVGEIADEPEGAVALAKLQRLLGGEVRVSKKKVATIIGGVSEELKQPLQQVPNKAPPVLEPLISSGIKPPNEPSAEKHKQSIEGSDASTLMTGLQG